MAARNPMDLRRRPIKLGRVVIPGTNGAFSLPTEDDDLAVYETYTHPKGGSTGQPTIEWIERAMKGGR